MKDENRMGDAVWSFKTICESLLISDFSLASLSQAYRQPFISGKGEEAAKRSCFDHRSMGEKRSH